MLSSPYLYGIMAANKAEDSWKYKIIPFNMNAAIILALVTAFAYSLAFAYEASYCQAFHIPKELINIDLALLTPFWTTVVITIVGLLVFFSWLYYFVIRKINTLMRDLIFSFLLVSVLRVGGETLLNVHFTWSFYALLLLLSFSSVFLNRWVSKHSTPAESSETAETQIANNGAQGASAEEVNRQLLTMVKQIRIFIVVAGALSILLCYNYSINSAENQALDQRSFFVLTHKPNIVVLKIYGDKIICGEYNASTRLLTGKIMSFKFGDNTPLEMEQKTFGPLIKVPSRPFFIWNWQITR